jgi:hypothetical protein
MKREKDDFYSTPETMTEALLQHEFPEPVLIHEPACGTGRMSKVLGSYNHRVISEDLIDRGFGKHSRDFLLCQERPCDYLVTNPPFKLAEKFVTHAINLGYKRHAWLLRLSFLEGQGRYNRLFTGHPFDICYVFSKRQTIWIGEDKPTSTGTTAYAWFVWGNESKQRIEWV